MIHSFAKVIVMDESIQPRGSETWLNFDVLSWQGSSVGSRCSIVTFSKASGTHSQPHPRALESILSISKKKEPHSCYYSTWLHRSALSCHCC